MKLTNPGNIKSITFACLVSLLVDALSVASVNFRRGYLVECCELISQIYFNKLNAIHFYYIRQIDISNLLPSFDRLMR